MVKVFLPRLLPDVPYIPLLYPNLGRQDRGSILFLNNAFKHLTEPLVEVVKDPARADYFLFPHNWSAVRRERAYLREFIELARVHRKKIIVFAHGDSDEAIPIPDSIVFRTSQYRYKKQPNEIIMPAYAEDLLEGRQFEPRHKSDAPTVGFCGWAGYKNLKNRIGTWVGDALIEREAKRTCNPRVLARKKGLTFRRQALAILDGSPFVRTDLKIRRSYSGHRETIGMEPAKAREEFIQNILGTDFSLVVKGDGNYSYRFYEVLSLGRIPLFLDTESLLPLEDEIAYQDCVVFVDIDDLPMLDQIAKAFYDNLTDDQFVEMQRKARETYETYLSVPAFLRYAVEHQLTAPGTMVGS